MDRAVITHAHSDHARFGSQRYLAAEVGANVLLSPLPGIALQTLAYGECIAIGDTVVSLHPAGHILGSSQVRIEHGGRVWVASGDYKLDPDPTCDPFEPVACDTFITESTFGLPIYRWDAAQSVFDGVDSWWRHKRGGRTRVGAVLLFVRQGATSAGECRRGHRSDLLSWRRGTAPREGKSHLQTGVDRRAAVGAGQRMAQTFRRLQRRVRFGLNASAQRAAQAWCGSRLRAVRSRGLAGPANGDSIDGRAARDRQHGSVEPMVRWLREQGLEAGASETQYGDDAVEADSAGAEEPAMSETTATVTATSGGA